MAEGRDVEEIAESDPEDLTDRELMVALATYAELKGEAEARQEHITACADRRRSGVLPALRNVFKSASSRLSLSYVEGIEKTVDDTAETRDEKFQECLTEATARFEDDPTAETANWGFH